MATSRRDRSAETERALKSAALRVFAERGYLSTKITDITTAAGRAAGSFYNHFASKEELLQSLLRDLADASDVRAEHPDHNPDFSDPAAVRYHVAGYWNYARAHAPVLRAVAQAATVSEDFARILTRFGVEQRADIADHLKGLADKGIQLPSGNDASLTMMFVTVHGLLSAVEAGAVELTDDEAIEGLTRFVYRGITGRDL